MSNARIEEVPQHVGQEVTIRGWLYNQRSSGGIQFLEIRDGTGIIQAVAKKDNLTEGLFEKIGDLNLESSIVIEGMVEEDERAPLGYELEVKDLKVQQLAQDNYPIGLKEHGPGFLMDNRHLWIRAPGAAPQLRIRHELMQSIRDFFHDRGFIATEAPILTGTSVEGTTTLFETEYFGDQAFLTQSGQLYLEATAAALGQVYWIGPVFRAEKSKTRKHLTEFWMVEAEMSWYEHEENLQLQEDLVHHAIRRVLSSRARELEKLSVDKENLRRQTKKPFPRITYREAVELVRDQDVKMEYGDDFGAPAEAALGNYFQKPVFIEAFSKSLKPFYMKPMPDSENVFAADLIAPGGYGEIIGGSQRIDDLKLLKNKLRERNLPLEPYQWYLDLRRYGSVPHSGFGLGVERTLAWLCNSEHVRETIPFPRQINRIYP